MRAEDVNRCTHMRATQLGTIEARQLRDGRWLYRTVYVCGNCGEHFTEQHVQAIERRVAGAER